MIINDYYSHENVSLEIKKDKKNCQSLLQRVVLYEI